MFGSHHQTLEDRIVSQLRSGSADTHSLLSYLRGGTPSLTKQGMYVALRKLIREEVVVKHSKRVSLSMVWLDKLQQFTSLASHTHGGTTEAGSYLSLEDGEKIRYEFNSLQTADAFWNHALYQIAKLGPRTPFLAYAPHCWFFLARPESERALRDHLTSNDIQYLVVAGSHSPLDTVVRKEFDDAMSQYHMYGQAPLPRPERHLNVFGDFVIEVELDRGISKEINAIYDAFNLSLSEATQRLSDTTLEKGRTRLTIQRHHKKAAKLRRSLTKPFHILTQPPRGTISA